MTYEYEMSAPGPLAPGNTQDRAPTTRLLRPMSRACARIPPDHLAVRVAASAAFVGGLALLVWQATLAVAAL